MNGAQLIIKLLEEHGVDVVFGYPGGTVLPVYKALYASKKIRHIRTSHEQGAAHAADGYARVSGKTGVCIATSGPGATNLVTGIANAYMDSVPTVFITANVPLSLIGTDSFQEVDITGITMSVTKHNFMIKNIEELAISVRSAFLIAESGRKGPVLIDVPKDILESEISLEYSNLRPNLKNLNIKLPELNFDILPFAAELINSSERPLILAGGGIKDSDASDSVLLLAERINAPICCSLMAIGEIPYSHRLYVGSPGEYGNKAANDALKDCDLIIAVGTRFSNRTAVEKFVKDASCKVIHIDTDRAEIKKIIQPDCYIVGDAQEAVSELAKIVSPREKWFSNCIKDEKTGDVLETIHDVFGDEAYIVTDVGLHQMWVAHGYPFEKKGHFITSGGLGTMGFGLGAAIGIQVAHPDKNVVLITGDGSFLMNCNELATVKSEKLPITIVVVNNGQLGMVKAMLKSNRKSKFTAIKSSLRFSSLARAFKIKGFKVKNGMELAEHAAVIKNKRIPAVFDLIRR